MIDVGALLDEASMTGSLAHSQATRDDWAARGRREGLADGEIEVSLRYHEMLVQRYADTATLFEVLWIRTLCEEVRHALDGERTKAGLDPDRSARPDVYYAFLTDTVLAEGGRLRRQLDCEEFGASDAELLRRRTEFRRGVMELSAQMTAVAVGPDPVLLLIEWRTHLFRAALRPADAGADWLPACRNAPHVLAAALGILLLDRQMGGAGDFSLASLVERPDYASWCDLAEQLSREKPETLRLALKAVYGEEFRRPVDEPPFPEIDVDGRLAGRGFNQEGCFRVREWDEERRRCFQETVRRRREVYTQARFTIRKGWFSRLTIDLTNRVFADGYAIYDCRWSGGAIVGRILAGPRPLRFPGLCCRFLDEKGKCLHQVLLDAPDLNPGEEGAFRIAGYRLRRAAGVVIDVPMF